ncbi:MAG: HPr family phosphocarrier protein [Pirellulales bacterium]
MNDSRARRSVVVNQPEGLHARPAELFVKVALQFDSKIDVVKDNQRVDAKSILHVLTLAAVEGTRLDLEAEGPDAKEAIDALAELVDSNFSIDGTMNQEPSS